MGYDRDLLLGVRVPLDGIASAAYESARNSETDLPVLTCAAARRPEGFFLFLGARPGRAMLLKGREETALIEKAAALPLEAICALVQTTAAIWRGYWRAAP